MGDELDVEQTSKMTAAERRATASLSAIYALRLLGLFMVLPVFALHAAEYDGSTAMLTGLAIGVYGLTQAVFQIPFGMLSDRIGRKRVIFMGLAIFAIGSLVAALSDSIAGVIVGRALQGAGAIAAAVLALTADLTREEQRTKAMAVIGGSIGLTFAAAIVLGPFVADAFGMSGVFWLTGILAVGAMGVLAWMVPNPERVSFHRDTSPIPAQFGRILSDPQLVRLNIGIGLLHFNMTAVFTALPLMLNRVLESHGIGQGTIYAVVVAATLVLIMPFIRMSDGGDRTRKVFLGAIVALVLTEAAFGLGLDSVAMVIAVMIVFFTTLMLLEAILPVLVSRFAPPDLKGTAMGAYSTCQFAGAFLGGAAGGYVHGLAGTHVVFFACAGIALAWLLVAAGMSVPASVATQLLRVGAMAPEQAESLAQRLLGVPGVTEAVVVADEGIAYLKVDRKRLDRDALMTYAAATP